MRLVPLATAVILICASFFFLCGCKKNHDPEYSRVVVSRITDSIVKFENKATAMRVTDPPAAAKYAAKALSLAKKIQSDSLMICELNTMGILLYSCGNDSAGYYLNLALQKSDSTLYRHERGSIFFNLACMHFDAGDYTKAVVLLDSSIHSFFHNGQPEMLASALTLVASVYAATHDTANERIYTDSIRKISLKYGLVSEWAIATGNLARFETNPEKAAEILRTAIAKLEPLPGKEMEKANLFVNLAVLLPDPDSALLYYQKALDIANKGHLVKVAVAAYNNMAYAFLDKNDPASADDIILNRAIPMADSAKDHDWLSTLADTYADVLIKKGRYADAINWLRRSTVERGEAEKEMAASQVRGLNALLEARSRNLLILEKEQQINRKSKHIRNLWTLTGIASGLSIILFILMILIRQRNRNRVQRMNLDAARRVIEAQENEKEKNGVELHDAIGAMSMKVNAAAERLLAGDYCEANMITGYIREFTESVRDISHHLNGKTLANQDFSPLLTNLCREYIQSGKLNLSYHIGEPVCPLPAITKINLYRVIHELLNNARKHAGPSECNILVDFTQASTTIVYQDWGPGFSAEEVTGKGMGLSNIYARIDLLNGTTVLDTFPGNGVYWKMEIPYIHLS
jgi:signal transduction histidine kinase